MRKIFTSFIAVFLTATIWAQSPNKMSYQAVIRNSNDALVTNTQIGVRISILQGSANGTVVYKEIYNPNPQTNANGLLTLEIGEGISIIGTFTGINWANGPYFIKTETDPTGGTSYTITGTSQLLSVPYALHAKTAENVTGEITETDPVFETWDKSAGISITESQISDLRNYLTSEVDGSVTNELQALFISHDTIYLSNGGFVKLPASIESDPVFNAWDKDYYDLTNQPAIPTVPSKVSKFTNDAGYLTNEVDGSVTNELQALSISNDTIYLSNGGFVKLPAAAAETDPAFNAWDKDYNDLTNQPAILTVPTNVSSFTNDAGYLTEEVDGSVTNELIESLALNGTTLEVTDAGGTKSADLSSLLTNETNCASCDLVLSILIHSEELGTLVDAGVPPLNLFNAGYGVGSLLQQGLPEQDLIDAGLIGTFIDERDNNEYKWVKIGNQIWMAENLAYLPAVVGPGTESVTTPYYYVYDYDGTNATEAKATYNYTTYGVLYNWPAALATCPSGWHLPSDNEWKQLEMAIGMSESEADATESRGINAGTKLRALSGWYDNGNGTDDYGFSALPGGHFSYTNDIIGGFFSDNIRFGLWWSASEYATSNAWLRYLAAGYSGVYRTSNFKKNNGFSVRCVKD